jgi:sulfur carrier protein ThiS
MTEDAALEVEAVQKSLTIANSEFVVANDAAPLPDRQWPATTVAQLRVSHVDRVD